MSSVHVPGAAWQQSACLQDLTTAGTAGTAYTDDAEWAGTYADGTRNPTGVPGIQIDGYFPDRSTTNAEHGWNHDSQFVIRLPDRWNGKLVVAPAPGFATQYRNDFIISDWVLGRGYAYASTDKGNTGPSFWQQSSGATAIQEWLYRLGQLTKATKRVVVQRYGHAPRRTYVTGGSNGGYVVRLALERDAARYDGGVDYEGTLLRPEIRYNLLTYLPVAVREYPGYRDGNEDAHRRMIAAGFQPGSEFLWETNEPVWESLGRAFQQAFDPGYEGDFANYDYGSRPPDVARAIRSVENTGAIGRPLITVHGTLDALLPIRTDSDRYARLVHRAGRDSMFRYYRIEDGTHGDASYESWPDRIRPMLPCYRAAFLAMQRWVERGVPPVSGRLVRDPHHGDVVNRCALGDVRYRA